MGSEPVEPCEDTPENDNMLQGISYKYRLEYYILIKDINGYYNLNGINNDLQLQYITIYINMYTQQTIISVPNQTQRLTK